MRQWSTLRVDIKKKEQHVLYGSYMLDLVNRNRYKGNGTTWQEITTFRFFPTLIDCVFVKAHTFLVRIFPCDLIMIHRKRETLESRLQSKCIFMSNKNVMAIQL